MLYPYFEFRVGATRATSSAHCSKTDAKLFVWCSITTNTAPPHAGDSSFIYIYPS